MMKIEDKLVTLGQQLSTVGTEYRLAQIGLEKMAEIYGMASPEAVSASQQCSALALSFSALEEEFLSLLMTTRYSGL